MPSRTIVRQTSVGSDPTPSRFVILSEVEMPGRTYAFRPTSVEMTMSEVCAALVAQGISEHDARALIQDAVAKDQP